LADIRSRGELAVRSRGRSPVDNAPFSLEIRQLEECVDARRRPGARRHPDPQLARQSSARAPLGRESDLGRPRPDLWGSWCADAAPGSNIDTQQNQPLALIPYEAIACTLDRFQAEAAEASIPQRMSYEVIGQSAGGRDLYGVVVNALETPDQQRDYDRWVRLRQIMLTDPVQGQALLASWGNQVKLPIFIEANIHGNEEESTDGIMQVIRDLVTTSYGVNATVDDLLDHAILIVIPVENPDGRVRGTRSNSNGFDMNRDLLVQSQPEIARTSRSSSSGWLPSGSRCTGTWIPR
jgi:murein tripeptide amidase MpaA